VEPLNAKTAKALTDFALREDFFSHRAQFRRELAP
jgi:hypothetical protein